MHLVHSNLKYFVGKNNVTLMYCIVFLTDAFMIFLWEEEPL